MSLLYLICRFPVSITKSSIKFTSTFMTFIILYNRKKRGSAGFIFQHFSNSAMSSGTQELSVSDLHSLT